ncbi:hypothetical protein ACJA25_02145 [Mycoplasmopsis hyopharyngis]|uniref:hypothetical protein n=1 Tax=Mycoplasmopsis hyopharyngis TaxID=29558 RepID=UPI003872B1A1
MKLKKSIFSKIISSVSLISIPIIFASSKCTNHKNDNAHNQGILPIQEPDSLIKELMNVKVKLKDQNLTIDQISINDLEFYDFDNSRFEIIEPQITADQYNVTIFVAFKLKEISSNKISQQVSLEMKNFKLTLKQVIKKIRIVTFYQDTFIEKLEPNDLYFQNLPFYFKVKYCNVEHDLDLEKVKISYKIIELNTNEESEEIVEYWKYNEFPIPKKALTEIGQNCKVILKNENVSINEILKLTFDQAVTLLRVNKRIKVIDKKIRKSKEKDHIDVIFRLQDPYALAISDTIIKKVKVNSKSISPILPFGS